MRSQRFLTIIGNPNSRPMTEFVAESCRQPFQPSPAQSVVLALRVRIIPTSIKNTFLLKKRFCPQQSPCLGASVMRRHCGSRKANRQAPRSLARRWLGSRCPLLKRRALTLPPWSVASSHVLAALARPRAPHISREQVKHVKAWWARRSRFAAC